MKADMNSLNIFINNYRKYLELKINELIKDSTYPEICKYIEMLPTDYNGEDYLFSWGYSFINEYYKLICKLDEIEGVEIDQLKRDIYTLYLKENYNKIVFTFDEFITFSKLLNVTFSDYNPDKTRKQDEEPYQSGDKKIDDKVNDIAQSVLHSPQPHAYEVTHFKLDILLEILNNKKFLILNDIFNKIDLDNELLNSVLSIGRIKKLKSKRDDNL